MQLASSASAVDTVVRAAAHYSGTILLFLESFNEKSAVAEGIASLVDRWQGVGFTHGVLNPDNMSIMGLTIDYGPSGYLDAFAPSYTPNTTDLPGRRYCFTNQPDIGLWNIAQFTRTLVAAKLIDDKEANYAMESKLLNNMAIDKVDYTNFFWFLSNIKADPNIPEEELLNPLKAVLLDNGQEQKEAWISWVNIYIEEERKASMNAVNPNYVLRNYLCQSAIDAAEQGDFEEVWRVLEVMERPYDEQPGKEKYARLPPAWAYRPGVCMLSCSS
ncbi:selenoprotein O-like [Pyrus ussuriensis x Pyrus communis]|uniref:Selenoprotein O n=1 Tax=Pyrus ussuriensis x Pyrus communis TaxID=2448454 RepID=A0A5N5FW83_9ROSA|nr:selenoprotein O-like [Pyrus ussuriensis x Pyrus communis]